MRYQQIAVYILASGKHGTLYVGVTSYLIKRIHQHREHVAEGFTKHYGVDQLVYYEMHETMEAAIRREKRLKKYTRAAKIKLIETNNPNWNDLWHEIVK